MRQVARSCTLAAATIMAVALLAGCSGGATHSSSGGSGAENPSATLPARWWQWAVAAPTASNPVSDTSGQSCGEHQPTDVWFLAGSFGKGPVTRTCVIPHARSVYFPVLNSICPASVKNYQKTLASCAMTLDQTIATLDGVPLTLRTDTSRGVFQLAPVTGSPLGLKSGDYVAWGSWGGPLGLSAGSHLLRINARSGTFQIDVTYHLTAE